MTGHIEMKVTCPECGGRVIVPEAALNSDIVKCERGHEAGTAGDARDAAKKLIAKTTKGEAAKMLKQSLGGKAGFRVK